MRAIEEKLACAHDEWTAILQTLRQEVERRAARSGPDYQQLVDAVNIVRDHENLIARALLRAVPVKVEVKTTERVAEGHIGGEPGDNSYYRDYDWVALEIGSGRYRVLLRYPDGRLEDPVRRLRSIREKKP
jgi:hypothetical protein